MRKKKGFQASSATLSQTELWCLLSVAQLRAGAPELCIPKERTACCALKCNHQRLVTLGSDDKAAGALMTQQR